MSDAHEENGNGSRTAAFARRLDEFAATFTAELAELRREVEALDSRDDEQAATLDSHAARLVAVERQDVEGLRRQVGAMATDMGLLRGEVGVLAGAVRGLSEALGRVQAAVTTLPASATKGGAKGAGVASAVVLIVIEALRRLAE